ncbi:hypothetical protein SDC9_203908 [bioreactor metagenome]|uniref:Uncharacterized protein n=1 Tax=bioreactor metagenome TaxID=1076179 RepID=A0A645IZD5_9ZZZZ
MRRQQGVGRQVSGVDEGRQPGVQAALRIEYRQQVAGWHFRTAGQDESARGMEGREALRHCLDVNRRDFRRY